MTAGGTRPSTSCQVSGPGSPSRGEAGLPATRTRTFCTPSRRVRVKTSWAKRAFSVAGSPERNSAERSTVAVPSARAKESRVVSLRDRRGQPGLGGRHRRVERGRVPGPGPGEEQFHGERPEVGQGADVQHAEVAGHGHRGAGGRRRGSRRPRWGRRRPEPRGWWSWPRPAVPAPARPAGSSPGRCRTASPPSAEDEGGPGPAPRLSVVHEAGRDGGRTMARRTPHAGLPSCAAVSGDLGRPRGFPHSRDGEDRLAGRRGWPRR